MCNSQTDSWNHFTFNNVAETDASSSRDTLVDETCNALVVHKNENLCLYGLSNETWEVNLPIEEVLHELPEPALGINFTRDRMQENDCLSLVAVHGDSWLLSVAFYFGAHFGFGKNESFSSSSKDKMMLCKTGPTCSVIPFPEESQYLERSDHESGPVKISIDNSKDNQLLHFVFHHFPP
ncbi:hypothetical protein FEM48_Zijuj09G0164200 [Ziziphus jujuba var. spinosa]|uniref:PHD finger protein ALFIN-LIKE n=1 Tax=Ziziphus jujuba var. spinosa TaxID=714518 RepID=A0A978UU16_ZIZJJ|nr:hypothetical protein FEM48_Zijuj09G0164200 [Ziziphus jujuba var. spinosa]